EAALAILGLGVRGVLISLGSAGAVAGWGETVERLPATPVTVPPGHLQTTVGAGDAMVARISVELARRGEEDVGEEAFIAMCRLAVAEAEAQIGGMAGSTEPPASTSRYPALLPADGECQGAVPMAD